MFNGHPDYERLIQIAEKLCISPKDEVETVLNSGKPALDAPGCRGNHEANRCG